MRPPGGILPIPDEKKADNEYAVTHQTCHISLLTDRIRKTPAAVLNKYWQQLIPKTHHTQFHMPVWMSSVVAREGCFAARHCVDNRLIRGAPCLSLWFASPSRKPPHGCRCYKIEIRVDAKWREQTATLVSQTLSTGRLRVWPSSPYALGAYRNRHRVQSEMA